MAKRVEQTKTWNFSITETFEDGRVETKKYHTKAGIRKFYDLSDMTIHRMLFTEGYVSRKYKNIKIVKIKQPARQVIQF
tara:strand:+ start:162 stop:398 length:237 start_codon:yes stop_codon:yes gene_type:complete